MTLWNAPNATDELRALFAEKPLLSASQIAARLQIKFGCYISRNAIIGKILRLGLVREGRAKFTPESRPKPVRRERFKTNSTKRPRTDDWHVSEAERSEPQATDLPPDQSDCAVTFMELTDKLCHWPLNSDPAAMMFCGVPGCDVAEKRPYCTRHCRIAYTKPPAPIRRYWNRNGARAA